MSSAVVSTSAALGRPFVFDATHDAHVGTAALGCPVEQGSTATHAAHLPGVARLDSRGRLSPHEHLIQSTHNQRFPAASIIPASRLTLRPVPEMVSSGVPAIDGLTGGLPRGCVTEICGPASSGRTTLVLSALAAATRRGEFCVVVDANDALDPYSAAAAGVDLDRLLWVRCGESSPPKKNSPQRHRVTEKHENQEEEWSTSHASLAREAGWREARAPEVGTPSEVAFNLERSQFAAFMAAAGASAAGYGFASRKRRLWHDRSRSRRPAGRGSAARSADHVVPLPARHRTYADDFARS